MTENMNIIAHAFDTDVETGVKFSKTDIAYGVCFAYAMDKDAIELLTDVAENTDWDKVKTAMGGRCDINGCYGVGSNGLIMELQWTTGIEFADGREGGGYIADISFDYDPSIATVAVEWNDKWIAEKGIAGRDDEANCMDILVNALKFGVENLLDDNESYIAA